jgi:acylphosphatase
MIGDIEWVQAQIIVRGRVQGVYFRACLKDQADGLGGSWMVQESSRRER